VQIAEYVGDRRQRVVASVGSAHTPTEPGIVMSGEPRRQPGHTAGG